MSMSTARIDPEKLRAFEQRMSSEGAAGFADGPAPWEDWDDALPIRGRSARKDDIPQLHRRKPHKPAKPLGQRLVSGITRLSVLALVVGIAGVYFTSGRQPQLAVNDTQSTPAEETKMPDSTPPLVVREPWQNSVIIDPNLLPAPAAGTPDIAVVAIKEEKPEIPQTTQISSVDEDTPAISTAPAVARMPDVATAPDVATVPDVAAADETPEMPASTPVQADTHNERTESVVALQQPATVPASAGTPAAAVQQGETSPPPTAQNAAGRWVVNLASYNRESTAQRMLDEFRDKGVTAELSRVTVNDKPMIRIRTSGHDSYREALDWAELLEERLELNGVWVSKR